MMSCRVVPNRLIDPAGWYSKNLYQKLEIIAERVLTRVNKYDKVRIMDIKLGKNATRLKEMRLRLELSQEKFAALLGVTLVTVNRWETGDCEPSQMAMKLSDQLAGRCKMERRERII